MKFISLKSLLKKITVSLNVTAALFFICSCNPSYNATQQNTTIETNVKDNLIHPLIVVYNYSEDSSVAFVKIYTSDLLYKNDSTALTGNIRINLFIYSAYSAKQFIDSTSIHFTNQKIDDDKSRYIVARLFFKKPVMPQYILKFEVFDFNRGTHAKKYVECSSNSNQNQFSFMMMPLGAEFPSFLNNVSATDSFHIYTRDHQPEKIFVRYFKREFTLAAPPHANYTSPHFSYIADSTFTSPLNGYAVFNFQKKGIYHFQFDTLKKSGFTVFKFGDDYPTVTHTDEMIGPLRYLTTKQEYAKIISSPSTGEAIEKFWIERAGNKERGRQLIKIFYSRVGDANKNFTSYLEGWKTDRGMIYIIFGKPDRMEKDDKQETWTYNSVAGNSGVLDFVFTKINNPFTENDFILIRSPHYEMPWYSTVDNWRQGRVGN